MNIMGSARLGLFAGAALLGLAGFARADDAPAVEGKLIHERKYEVFMTLPGQAEAKVGDSTERKVEKNGEIIYSEDTKIAIGRGAINIEMTSGTVFVETKDGKPL